MKHAKMNKWLLGLVAAAGMLFAAMPAQARDWDHHRYYYHHHSHYYGYYPDGGYYPYYYGPVGYGYYGYPGYYYGPGVSIHFGGGWHRW